MAERGQPTPIIKKVIKKGHAGHHGGAWKVAYADFVTAMMALFMVLWIVGQSSKEAKEAIADYFRTPGIFPTTDAGGRKLAPLVPDPTASGEGGVLNMPSTKPPQEALADIMRLQQKMQETVVEATSGGGTVTAKMDGRKQLLSLRIDPEAVKSGDIEMLQDLVVAAVNEAGRKVDGQMQSSLGGMLGGLGIPGL